MFATQTQRSYIVNCGHRNVSQGQWCSQPPFSRGTSLPLRNGTASVRRTERHVVGLRARHRQRRGVTGARAHSPRARGRRRARACVCEGQSAPGSVVIMEKERAAGAGGGGSRVIVAPRRGVLPPAAVALRDLRNAHNASSSAGVSSAGVRVRMCAGVPGAWTRDAIVSSCLPPWRL